MSTSSLKKSAVRSFKGVLGQGCHLALRGCPGVRLQRRCAFSYPSPRELNQVVHLAKFVRETPANCVSLWSLHHSTKPTMLGCALSATEYVAFAQRASKYPWFVFPLLRAADGNSYVSMLCQVQDSRYVLFTYLQEYREHAATAQPRVVFTVYPELVAEKQLALVRLENLHEGQLEKADLWRLWCQWRHLYAAADTAGLQLLADFNERPRVFRFEKALEVACKLYAERE